MPHLREAQGSRGKSKGQGTTKPKGRQRKGRGKTKERQRKSKGKTDEKQSKD